MKLKMGKDMTAKTLQINLAGVHNLITKAYRN